MGINWNPIDWANDVFSDAWHIGAGILNAIVHGIQVALRLFGDAVEFFVQEVVDPVRNAGLDALGFIDDLFHRVTSAIDTAWHYAQDALGKAWDHIEHWAARLGNDIGNAVATAANDLGHAVSWVTDHIGQVADRLLHTAEDLARHALHDAMQWAGDLLGFFKRDVIGPLVHLVEEILHDLHRVLDWFDHGVLDAWHVIEKAWDWIVWFAEHSFQLIDEIEGGALSMIKGQTAGAVTDQARNALPRAERFIHDVFGL